jgi:hypothetical protein
MLSMMVADPCQRFFGAQPGILSAKAAVAAAAAGKTATRKTTAVNNSSESEIKRTI